MMSPQERKRHYTRQQELRWAKINAVVSRMKSEGWDPIRLSGGGNSVRFSCTVPGYEGRKVVAIKTVGRGQYESAGRLGFHQKYARGWGSPMKDSDLLRDKMGVWLIPMPRAIEHLEEAQKFYTKRGRAKNGAIWMTLSPEGAPGFDPSQCNFADGADPLWIMELPWASEPSEPPDVEDEAVLPTPLASFTIGQLIDELQRRGLKSFSF
jgi:hypothetical protein